MGVAAGCDLAEKEQRVMEGGGREIAGR